MTRRAVPDPLRAVDTRYAGAMAPNHQGASRHTGLALAGIAAIPVASVSVAAWLGETASSTDPRDAVAGLVALLGGLVMGLLVRRLIVSVDRRVRGVVRFVAAAFRPTPEPIVDLGSSIRRRRLERHPVPVLAFVPADVGRRGPPIRLR